MARNSSGVYVLPTGSTAVSHAAIASQAYNTFLNDIATAMTDSLNVQGTAPMQAALNMGGFKAVNVGDPTSAQDAVTKNYFSLNAVNIQGTATMVAALNLGGFKIINVADPTLAQDAATLHYLTTNYVPITGGFYSGAIGISATGPVFTLSKATGANSNVLNGSTAGTNRWTLSLGNSATESGLNAGSNFDLSSYSDAGTLISTIFTINRASGATVFNNTVNFSGTLNANSAANLTGGGTLSGGFAVSGTATFANGLTVNGSAATLNAGLTVTGATSLAALTASGATSLAALTASGLATLNAGLAVTGAASFGSTPTHPTPAAADNSTKSATTAFLYSNVGSAVSQLAFGAVGTLCAAAGPNGLAPGATTAGSGLTTFNSNSATSQTLTGTWVYLGNSSFSANGQLYMRIA